MKNLFISLIFCFAISKTMAQSTIQGTEEAPNWPVLLSNLPTSQITSGVLYDKVTPFANLNTFNNTDNNTSKFEHFQQALSELYRASDQARFITLAELKNRTATTTATNSVDIGIINTTFEKLYYNEQNPSTAGLLFQNSKFVPIAGKPSFLYKKVVVASPLKDVITGSSFNFNFKTNLIFNNATTAIKTLVVDFADGTTPTTIIGNSSIITPTKAVNYATKGNKSIKFTFTFSDNSTKITFGKVYVNFVSNAQAMVAPNTTNGVLPCYEFLKDKGVFTSALPFKGYDENYAVYGKTEYTIFYHTMNGTAINNQKTLNQPIIIVDGFDPKDKRKVQDCDCENDPTGDCIKNNDMQDSGFNAETYDSLEDLMNYNVTPTIKLNLITELRKKGYDVIVINNPTYTSVNTAGQSVKIDGGADYIERNAYTLASFMKDYLKVNQVGTAQPVLIGPSMGGQITRFALAYMEKKFAETNDINWKHNARLWVSVDSPHLGANIPVGAQASIWFFAEKLYNEKAKIQYNEELNSVAGKQQILNQLKNAQDNGGILNNSTFFNTYYSSLNSNGVAGSNGYPVTNSTFRKIAMVNGSLTGVKDAGEQQTFLYTRGYYNTNWAGFLVSPLAGIGSMLFANWTVTVLRNRSNFSPTTGQTATVFEGDGQNFDIGLNHWFISHPRYKLNHANLDIKGSLDVVPGGYFKTAKLIREALEKGLNDKGVNSETRDYIENHSFIPAFSALGHLQPNQNWANPLNANLACPSNKLTPFDSYYGTTVNTEHTSFTKESADWLYKELAGNPQAPHFPIQSGLLTGLDLICENQTSNYSFGSDDCKLPSLVQSWTLSSTTLQVISSNGFDIIVKGIGNGQGTITATFQNGQTVIKNIWVGKPSFNLVYNYFEPQPIKSTIDMVSNQPDLTIEQQGITSTTFLGTRNNSSYFNMLRSGLYSARANTSSVNQVIATATNSCGTTTLTVNFIDILKQSGNTIPPKVDSKIYSVFPNPASSIVSIELNDIYNQPDSSSIISGELFDMMGLSKSKVEIKDNKAVFSVVGLLKGIYVLKIYINDQVESHQIGVE